jgi:phasin family protein
MNTDFIKDLGEKAKESVEPMGKINKLVTESIQSTLKFQMESAKKYSDLAADQLKALSSVKDLESMQEFVKGQSDAMTKFNEQIMNDVHALGESGVKFREDLEGILNPKPAKKEKATTKPAASAAKKAPAKTPAKTAVKTAQKTAPKTAPKTTPASE